MLASDLLTPWDHGMNPSTYSKTLSKITANSWEALYLVVQLLIQPVLSLVSTIPKQMENLAPSDIFTNTPVRQPQWVPDFFEDLQEWETEEETTS